MKRSVNVSLTFDSKSGRDDFIATLKDDLKGKDIFDKSVSSSESMEGEPQMRERVRFNKKSQGDEHYQFVKKQMGDNPVSGKVTIHDCYNDDDVPRSCEIEKSYDK